ncbi:Sexual differentiation process protein [Lachnellula subtilissima]|uniref:Sexual differentiation process protein n=1 Tax=Lachnellula subtilissima TaxID=602034 RepID=A0A8H8UDC0_9HELO|nr:Sexual differentiation process protein [Lachnellula subtilissima]
MFSRFRGQKEPKDGIAEEVSSVDGGTRIGSTTSDVPDVETEAVANAHLKTFNKLHEFDPNLPEDLRLAVNAAAENHDLKDELKLEQEVSDNSPYPEVRAAVRNYDDGGPANTVRAWVIGMVLVTIASGLNQLFFLRYPNFALSSLICQLVAYPIGCAWARWLPEWEFNWFGLKWKLNPGPFNMKEHTVITVMANCSLSGPVAYSVDTIVALKGFYKKDLGWGFNLLLTVSNQVIGYGLAGVCRRFLVWPAAMIWPTNLVSTSVFYALHDHRKSDPEKTSGWSIGRYRYFLYVVLGSFVWHWFPELIAPFLSVFAFVTWIKPNSPVINQLFGGSSGLSLIPITFDWNIVTQFIQSPLQFPVFAMVNVAISMVLFFWIITPALHFSGACYGEYLPILDNTIRDNTGKAYNVTKVLTPDLRFDAAAYKEYSPLFMSQGNIWFYSMSFAAISGVLVHTALYERKAIWARFKDARVEDEDVHRRLMRKYREVPEWWYIAIFIVMFAVSIVVVQVWDTGLPVWALILAYMLPIIFMIPIGIVQAVTNFQIGLNIITELIVGFMLPGRPIAMMLFKAYGYAPMYQGLLFTGDLKLGHYMKVPPRTMMAAQGVATFWAGIVNVAVLEWAFGAIKNICDAGNTNGFICPVGRSAFNSSVIFGVIGPQRLFGMSGLYKNFLWMFLVGALTPCLFYTLTRMFPKSKVRYLSTPLIFGGVLFIPPATPLTYMSWVIVGLTFNYFIRRKYTGWWNQYNYLTSGGLDLGLALCLIVMFFAVSVPQKAFPDWWGTTVVANTLDSLDAAVQTKLPKGQTFGPPKGSWS